MDTIIESIISFLNLMDFGILHSWHVAKSNKKKEDFRLNNNKLLLQLLQVEWTGKKDGKKLDDRIKMKYNVEKIL